MEDKRGNDKQDNYAEAVHDRGLDAGNMGQTDVVKRVLKHGLRQAEPEYVRALTASFGVKEPAVNHAHNSDGENTGKREANACIHPCVRHHGRVHIKQQITDLDAGKSTAPQKAGKHRKRNGDDNTAEYRLLFCFFHIYIPHKKSTHCRINNSVCKLLN